jgi:hypothetical protein
MNNEKFIVEQQISNDPLFPHIERYVQIFFPLPNALDETLELRYFIRYMDGAENVTYKFNQSMPLWKVSNNDKIMKRALPDFTPIPNPDYDPEAEFSQDEFLMERAFDYLKELSEIVPFNVLLRWYILDENADPNGRWSR